MSTYNGWTNYETWATKLWMDNDQGAQEYWQEQAEHYRDEPWKFAKAIKAEHEEQAPEIHGVFSDLLGAALGAVNWDEIAQSLIADLEPVDAQTEEESA